MIFLFVKKPFIPKVVLDYLADQVEFKLALNNKIFAQRHRTNNQSPQFELPLDNVLNHYQGRVLILWGDADRVLDVSGAEVLAELLPQAEVIVMANVGHLPMLEQPKQTALSYLAFLKR